MIAGPFVWRIAGSILLVAAAGTGYMQAGATAVQATSLGAAASWAGGLIAFALACLGLLLILHGPTLRRRWKADCERAASAREMMAPPRSDHGDAQPELDPLLFLDPGLGGGRMAMTTFLILRAQQRSTPPRRSQRRPRPGDRQNRPAPLHKASM